jgi:hypothetical protein
MIQAGPSNLSQACLSTTTPIYNGKPLPVTDWSRPAGPSSSSRPPRNDRGPHQPRSPRNDQGPQQSRSPRNARGQQQPRPPPGDQDRPSRPRQGPFPGMMPRESNRSNGPRTPSVRGAIQSRPARDDLATSLKKWNVSAAPEKRDDQREDGETEGNRRLPVSERFNNEEEPELDTRHGRRLKPGEKGLSRSFDAVRKASGGGDFSLDRGHARHGSKKGKEREFESNRSPRLDPSKKADKPKRTQKAKQTEKEVYVPSTVTVSRLADIFGVKICKSSSLALWVVLTTNSQPSNPDDAFRDGGRSAETRLL